MKDFLGYKYSILANISFLQPLESFLLLYLKNLIFFILLILLSLAFLLFLLIFLSLLSKVFSSILCTQFLFYESIGGVVKYFSVFSSIILLFLLQALSVECFLFSEDFLNLLGGFDTLEALQDGS